MADNLITGGPAELTFKLTVTKPDGSSKTYDMIGKVINSGETDDVSNTLNSSEGRGD